MIEKERMLELSKLSYEIWESLPRGAEHEELCEQARTAVGYDPEKNSILGKTGEEYRFVVRTVVSARRVALDAARLRRTYLSQE